VANIEFLIIGAQKAGTTALFEYVRRHPNVHMPVEKDIAFFNRDGNFRRGWDWYQSVVLRNAPADAVCGEASTYYMSGTPFGEILKNEQNGVPPVAKEDEPLEDVVPSRIKEFLPDVRLIAVMRDPVARAYSHHRMMALEKAETRSFDDAITELMEPSRLERARIAPTRTNNYIVNGEYGRVLAGFLRIFPRDQLLTITSDHLSDKPAEAVAEFFEFIGVSPNFVPDNIGMKYRLAAEEERIKGLSLDRLQMNLAKSRSAKAVWHALPDGLRERIDRGFRVGSYRTVMWNAKRGVVAGDDISPEVRRRLEVHFRSDGEALEDLLGKNIPWLKSWDRNSG
jgi:hypothetical protein